MRTVVRLLPLLLAGLALFGYAMLVSAAEPFSERVLSDPDRIMIRQGVWLLASFVVAAVAARVDYHRWRRLAIPLVVVTALLLILCFVPGIGRRFNGSNRWIHLGITVQPSELAKFTVVLFLAAWVQDNRRRVREFVHGVVQPLMVMGAIAGLILIETDFGTTALITAAGLGVLFMGGMALRHLGALAAALAGVFWAGISYSEEHRNRFLAWLHPERYAETDAMQLMQSYRAFGLGGLFGVGWNNSVQKQINLPESHTDFIFPIIGEEMGLVVTLAVVAVYLAVFVIGMVIALRAPDSFGRMLAMGIVLTFSLQAAINLGVVTGCLPTKGIALPLISYGGSGLLSFGLMLGVLINIGRHAAGLVADTDTLQIRNAVRAV